MRSAVTQQPMPRTMPANTSRSQWTDKKSVERTTQAASGRTTHCKRLNPGLKAKKHVITLIAVWRLGRQFPE